jgi:hypothetical protein
VSFLYLYRRGDCIFSVFTFYWELFHDRTFFVDKLNWFDRVGVTFVWSNPNVRSCFCVIIITSNYQWLFWCGRQGRIRDFRFCWISVSEYGTQMKLMEDDIGPKWRVFIKIFFDRSLRKRNVFLTRTPPPLNYFCLKWNSIFFRI